MKKLAIRMVIGAVCAFVVSGCAASASEPTGTNEEAFGKLSVTWTFIERNDSKMCASSGIAAISLNVADDHGTAMGTYSEPCTTMAKTIALPPGSYLATATALDAEGAPRSIALQTDPFTLTGTDRVMTNIDFAPGALY